jgi:hypothetical protein
VRGVSQQIIGGRQCTKKVADSKLHACGV